MILYTKITGFFKGDKRSVTVKKNAIASVFIKGVSIIISLLLVPITLGYMSSELYGIWLTLSSIVIWLNFFDIGFTMGLKNRLTEAIAKDDWERGKQLVSTTYIMMVIIFIPLCLLIELSIPHFDWCSILNVQEVYKIDIIKTIYILVGCFCLQMIVNVFTTVVAAFQKVALSSVFSVIGQVISLIAIIILTKICPPSLTILAATLSAIPIIVIIIASFILYNRRFKRLSPSLSYFNKSLIKDLFSLGYKFFLIQIQVVVLYQTTNILISHVAGPDEVTQYNIAYKYLGVPMMVLQLLLNPLWPAFTDAYTKRDYEWMQRIYKRLTKLYFGIFGVILLMVIVSPFVYHLWIGNKTTVPFMLTIAISVYIALHCWDLIQVTLVGGIGTIKLETYIITIGLFLYLPLALFLGKEMGAIGIVNSMTLVNIIYASVFTIQIRKIISNKAKGIWLK